MKYYIIAGEKSGDLHASNLIKELKIRDKSAEFRGWGGDEMEKIGVTLVQHYRETAFMGFTTVFVNLPKIFKFLKKCKKDILDYQPDVVILVDYAGFNLRIAKFAKKHGLKTFYYISPKVWAWNTGRAKKIKRDVDKMFVILHFEKKFYKQFDYQVDYIGNPLFDAIDQFKPNPHFLVENQLTQKPIIALLPGSREMEVRNVVQTMGEVSKYFSEFQFVCAGVKSVSSELYQICEKYQIPILYDQTYDLLNVAHSAVVTSGTATLETALFEVPQVVCYKTNFLQYHISKKVIQVPYISLVNLIAQKEVVRELIQYDYTTKNLEEELKNVIHQKREQILIDYRDLKALIKTEGVSKTAAELMYNYLKI